MICVASVDYSPKGKNRRISRQSNTSPTHVTLTHHTSFMLYFHTSFMRIFQRLKNVILHLLGSHFALISIGQWTFTNDDCQSMAQYQATNCVKMLSTNCKGKDKIEGYILESNHMEVRNKSKANRSTFQCVKWYRIASPLKTSVTTLHNLDMCRYNKLKRLPA